MDSLIEQEEWDANELLIQCVEQQPCIYDKKREDYKNKTKNMRAWATVIQTMAEIIGKIIPVKDAQGRWKTLRRVFAEEYKKRNARIPSGSACPPTNPEWKYYAMMSFLERHILHRRTVSTFSLHLEEGEENKEKDDELEYDYDEDGTTDDDEECLNTPSTSGTSHKSSKIDTVSRSEELPDKVKELSQFINERGQAKKKEVLLLEHKIEDLTKQTENFKQSLLDGKLVHDPPLEKLINCEKKYEIRKLDEYQTLLVDAFENVPPNKKMKMLNKLIDILEEDLEN